MGELMIMARDCAANVLVMWKPYPEDNPVEYLHQLTTGAMKDSNGQHYVQLKAFGHRKIYLNSIRLATLDEQKAGR